MRKARSLLCLLAVCLATFVSQALAGQAIEVDLQLVLAADVSGSMSRSELVFQRDGYADALRRPDVVETILSGGFGRIAVTYVEWAGRDNQAVVVPWTILSSPADITAFVRNLLVAPIAPSHLGTNTALSSSLLFCAELLRSSGLKSPRRTIDVSGDGIGNEGPPLAEAREKVLGDGIVVNGLSIDLAGSGPYGPFAAMFGSNPGDVHAYYRNELIGGPGAFALAIDDLRDFPDAIRRKLVLEIAAR